jgi:hypothetical protein
MKLIGSSFDERWHIARPQADTDFVFRTSCTEPSLYTNPATSCFLSNIFKCTYSVTRTRNSKNLCVSSFFATLRLCVRLLFTCGGAALCSFVPSCLCVLLGLPDRSRQRLQNTSRDTVLEFFCDPVSLTKICLLELSKRYSKRNVTPSSFNAGATVKLNALRLGTPVLVP